MSEKIPWKPDKECLKCGNHKGNPGKCDTCFGRVHSTPTNWIPISKWLQATKELLENDTRTVEEGKDHWYVLYKGRMYYLQFHRIYDRNGELEPFAQMDELKGYRHCWILDNIKIQPGPTPPALEEG